MRARRVCRHEETALGFCIMLIYRKEKKKKNTEQISAAARRHPQCAPLVRALETAARRQTTPEMVTIFTDAQAAIRRMGSDEPGPCQMYAIQARNTSCRASRGQSGR